MTKDLTIKSTITKIKECWDKNTLTNSPQKLINQRVTITYRNFVSFAKIKEISE